MVRTGYSPSVRLFEAAACGSPIISDPWDGLEGLFMPEAEIMIAENSGDIMRALLEIPETSRLAIEAAGSSRVMEENSSERRGEELETWLQTGRADGCTPVTNATTGWRNQIEEIKACTD